MKIIYSPAVLVDVVHIGGRPDTQFVPAYDASDVLQEIEPLVRLHAPLSLRRKERLSANGNAAGSF